MANRHLKHKELRQDKPNKAHKDKVNTKVLGGIIKIEDLKKGRARKEAHDNEAGERNSGKNLS